MLKGLLLASGSVLAFIIYGKDYGGKLGFGRLCALSGSFICWFLCLIFSIATLTSDKNYNFDFYLSIIIVFAFPAVIAALAIFQRRKESPNNVKIDSDLKSTATRTSNTLQKLRDKTIFEANPEKKAAYDYNSKPESNVEKAVNKEEFKVAESASGERSDSELNCKEYKISPDYPAGTYYVISNGERPHLMVVDTKGNTEKRKYYKVTNVFKVKLKPNRIVKCVDCELRK